MSHTAKTNVALLIALTLGVAACQAETTAGPRYPGELQPPDRFTRDFLLRQQLVFRCGEVEHSLQTALQHHGDTLTLIGLTPLGTRAFVLRQQGLEVAFTSHLPEEQELPFSPRCILFDIQRTLLPVLDERAYGDGEHRIQLGDEVVRERWEGGRLLERRFRRRSGEPSGELMITYHDSYFYNEAPGRIVIENGWLGYQITLTTLDYLDL